MPPPLRIVVIGGGISGLATAYYVQTLSREAHLPVSITLLEAQRRFGGVIETQARDGFLLEGGPDAFLVEQPWAITLCRQLGLAEQLIRTQPTYRRSFLVRHGQLVPIPAGWYLIAPPHLTTLLRTPLLSWTGKLRMVCEPLVPQRQSGADESVGHFIRRRFGREALERIGQPMIGGIYTADPDQLSLRAAMPKLDEMEQRHGSVIAALRATRQRRHGATAQTTADHQDPLAAASGPRYSLFVTLRGGIQQLIESLIQHLSSVTLRHSATVSRISSGSVWTVTLNDGAVIEADVLCLALPTQHAATLLDPIDAMAAHALRGIPYESVATVNVAFRRADLPRPLDGFGLVIPAIERRRLIGCTFSSVKFADRAPADSVLLRAFVGGALQRDLVDLDDEAMQRMVREELRTLLGIQAPPLFAMIRRFRQSMPQYHVGHLERVAAFEARVAQHQGLFVTGNGYHGIGIPDCIYHAQHTAQRMLHWLTAQEASLHVGIPS